MVSTLSDVPENPPYQYNEHSFPLLESDDSDEGPSWQQMDRLGYNLAVRIIARDR